MDGNPMRVPATASHIIAPSAADAVQTIRTSHSTVPTSVADQLATTTIADEPLPRSAPHSTIHDSHSDTVTADGVPTHEYFDAAATWQQLYSPSHA